MVIFALDNAQYINVLYKRIEWLWGDDMGKTPEYTKNAIRNYQAGKDRVNLLLDYGTKERIKKIWGRYQHNCLYQKINRKRFERFRGGCLWTGSETGSETGIRTDAGTDTGAGAGTDVATGAGTSAGTDRNVSEATGRSAVVYAIVFDVGYLCEDFDWKQTRKRGMHDDENKRKNLPDHWNGRGR